jgi:two-component system phosphate regulon sensor histidine kinase PhoR
LLLTLTAALLAWPIGELLTLWLGWAFFCGSLGIQLASHLRNFSRLERWSHAPEVDRNLEGEGAWDDVFGRVYRHEKDLREQIARRDEEVVLLIAANQALNDGIVLLDRHNQISLQHDGRSATWPEMATDGFVSVNLVRQRIRRLP